MLTGAAAINGTGNALANRLTGNGFEGGVTEPMLPGSWDTEGGANR